MFYHFSLATVLVGFVAVFGLSSCAPDNASTQYDQVRVQMDWGKDLKAAGSEVGYASLIHLESSELSTLRVRSLATCILKNGKNLKSQREFLARTEIVLADFLPEALMAWPKHYWDELLGCSLQIEFQNSLGSKQIHRTPLFRPSVQSLAPETLKLAPTLGELDLSVESAQFWSLPTSSDQEVQLICENQSGAPSSNARTLADLLPKKALSELENCRLIGREQNRLTAVSAPFELQSSQSPLEVKVLRISQKPSFSGKRIHSELQISNESQKPARIRFQTPPLQSGRLQVHTNKSSAEFNLLLNYSIQGGRVQKDKGWVEVEIPAGGKVSLRLEQSFSLQCRPKDHQKVIGHYLWLEEPLRVERISSDLTGQPRVLDSLEWGRGPIWLETQKAEAPAFKSRPGQNDFNCEIKP